MHVTNINPEYSPHLSSVDFSSAACNYEIFCILFLRMNGNGISFSVFILISPQTAPFGADDPRV